MRNNISKIIIGISLLIPFLFPILYSSGLFNQSSFPKAIFFFFCSQIIGFLFIWYGVNRGIIKVPKDYLGLGLLIYILVLFLTGILGENFQQSFWSYYPHMTGIITWVHFFIFYIVISSLYQEINWKHFFRALSLSTIVLLFFSYLGPDGFNLPIFLESGGSLLTNNTKSGMYYVILFFLSFIGLSLEKNKKWRYIYFLVLIAIFFSPELFSHDLLSGNMSLRTAINYPSNLLGVARTSTIALWFGMIVSLVLYLVHKFTKEKKRRILSVGGIILIFVIYGIFFLFLMKENGKVSEIYIQNSGPSRLMVWDTTTSAIIDKPILGYGIENFDYVYQQNLNAEIINLENGGAWFDRAHNFILDELNDVGVVGFLVVVMLFIAVIRTSYIAYSKQPKFHFLLIPYIFVFHFIQIQTSFETITSMFLVFILLAYLSSQNEERFNINISQKVKNTIKVVTVLLLVLSFYFAVYLPLKQSSMLKTLEHSGTFEKRIEYYKKNETSMKNLLISPDQTIQRYVNEYIYSLTAYIDTVYEYKQEEQAKEEISLYLDLYESYYPQYQDKYKFLIYYAHTIDFAYIFGIDDLKKGEKLAHEALSISRAYPHPFWLLAINLYYQGKNDEALSYAKEGYDIGPTIKQSKELYETLLNRIGSPKAQPSPLYLNF